MHEGPMALEPAAHDRSWNQAQPFDFESSNKIAIESSFSPTLGRPCDQARPFDFAAPPRLVLVANISVSVCLPLFDFKTQITLRALSQRGD